MPPVTRGRRLRARVGVCGIALVMTFALTTGGGVARAAAGPASGAGDNPCRRSSPPTSLNVPNPSPNELDKFLTEIGQNALKKGGEAALGWVMNVIFSGGSGTDGQIQQISAQLQAISNQVAQIQATLDKFIDFVAKRFNVTDYRNKVNELSQDRARLRTWDQTFEAGSQQPIGSKLTDTQRQTLAAIRDPTTGARVIINHINDVMCYTTSLSTSAIDLFDDLAWKNQSFLQTQTLRDAVYTSDYLTPAYDQIDTFKGLMADALNLLAEAFHTDFTWQQQHYDVDGKVVEQYSAIVDQAVREWSAIAAHSIGRIPEGTVVDVRSGLMWGRDQVDISEKSRYLPCWQRDPNVHCYPVAAWGFLDHYVWVRASTTEVPIISIVSVKTAVDRLRLAGFSDWRVPAFDEWKKLVGDTKDDLMAWTKAQGFGKVLAPADPISYSGAPPIETEPFFVDTALPYGIMVWANFDNKPSAFGTRYIGGCASGTCVEYAPLRSNIEVVRSLAPKSSGKSASKSPDDDSSPPRGRPSAPGFVTTSDASAAHTPFCTAARELVDTLNRIPSADDQPKEALRLYGELRNGVKELQTKAPDTIAAPMALVAQASEQQDRAIAAQVHGDIPSQADIPGLSDAQRSVEEYLASGCGVRSAS